MKKYKLLAAITLSLTLTVGSVVYAAPAVQESRVQIDTEGPSGEGGGSTEELSEPGLAAAANSGSSQQQTSEEANTVGQTGTTDAADILAPSIQSEGAVLLDASTGTVLYGKNENTQFFPASITKLMTGLLVVENCSLDDIVTFSKGATTNLEAGSVTLNLTEGDALTVRDSLYALFLKSANEVANGLAEKVSGSVPAFAEKMNARAAELGCKNTHFVNPNGLNNDQHYTTPYDMALIARAAFANEILRKIDSTTSYKIPATKKVASERTITMGHKMFYTTDSRYYPGIIGGKTGYTSKAGNTLVTGVDKNGIRLIAVIMKSKGTHYQDTKALFDYGFANRDKLLAAGGSQPGKQSEEQSTEAQNPPSHTGAWSQNGNKMYYTKADGRKAAGEWLKIGNNEYWFDADGAMATGWREFTNGDWYYFGTNGAMVTNRWIENAGKLFYLDSTGVMLKNTKTPDGFEVDQSGARK